MGDQLRAAQTYAKKFGWRVFPVYSVREDGVCSCRNPEDHSIGKHPRINEWQKTATTDAAQIAKWWGQWPDANIGVACGEGSGIVVLDIDKRHGGDDSLAFLEEKHGKLPETPQVLTGGGGTHYFFRHPGQKIPNSAGRVGPGIDIRGDGGYVLVPRSNHSSGRLYEWEVTTKIGMLPLAELPDWLRVAIVDKARGIEIDPDDDSPVKDGARHDTLLKIAGRMRKAGLGPSEIYAALNDFNQRRCQPPQPNDDVRQIAYDIGHKPTAEAIVEAVAKGRFQIKTNDRDYWELLTETWKALLYKNDPPIFYRKNDLLVGLQEDVDGASLRPISYEIAYDILARHIAWYRATSTKTGTTIKNSDQPPARLARSIVADVSLDVPRLDLIARAPIFSQGGNLLLTNGYHPEARAWVDMKGLTIKSVPENPTNEDVSEARRVLHDELLFDFPFVNEAHYANAIALLILPFIRPMIFGSTPLFFIESPSQGSGKTLLAKIVYAVATGGDLPGNTLPSDEEEVRKVITSELLAGKSMVVFDNFAAKRRLDSSAVAAMLTSLRWSSRILGESRNVEIVNHIIWIMTGNNPNVGRDLLRRSCQIRLDPGVESPWSREGFRHADLLSWAKRYRAELIWAIVVIVRNWVARGKPLGDCKINLGSFEDWTRVTAGILTAAGYQGFLANSIEYYEQADWEDQAIRKFIEDWKEKFGDILVRVADLVDVVQGNEDLELRLAQGAHNDHQRRTNLGILLRNNVGRVFGEVKIERLFDTHTKTWKYKLTKTEVGNN
jgi:hypothetical protein